MPLEATAHDGKKVPVMNTFGTSGELYGATFTIATEDSNVVNVSIQLTDFRGASLATRAGMFAYLSDDANGDSVGTAHSTSPGIGTDGLLAVVVTDLSFYLVSESTGIIDIDFTDSGTQTIYLILVMPDGRLVASGAITHAA